MTTGFVIGKFYPFHQGHAYLLDVARSQCDRLIVWVCDRAQQIVPGQTRAAWIRELFPDVQVFVVPDTLDDGDTDGWASYTLRILGTAPDIVFSSEDYGPAYAARMGSRHVMVDRSRIHTPISGSLIRKDPAESWEYLSAPARAYFARRIVVVGAESTGTTTLTLALAAHYRTTSVPEYGREYTERKLAVGDVRWRTEEFAHIAAEQVRRTDEAARTCNRILLCDTDAFATTLWHERYLGFRSPAVERIASAQRPIERYIVTGDEIPFVQDGTRDGEHIRRRMNREFIRELTHRGLPFIVVSGDRQERLARAVAFIDGTRDRSVDAMPYRRIVYAVH